MKRAMGDRNRVTAPPRRRRRARIVATLVFAGLWLAFAPGARAATLVAPASSPITTAAAIGVTPDGSIWFADAIKGVRITSRTR